VSIFVHPFQKRVGKKHSHSAGAFFNPNHRNFH
jgi:hypothetical protein